MNRVNTPVIDCVGWGWGWDWGAVDKSVAAAVGASVASLQPGVICSVTIITLRGRLSARVCSLFL